MLNRLFLCVVIMFVLVPKSWAQNGLMICDTWTNVTLPNGDPQALANNPNLLGTPTTTTTHGYFETSVSNLSVKFVRRCRAKLVNAAPGGYTFWVASNGVSKLWHGNDQNFVNKAPIAQMMQSIAPTRGSWTRYAEQKSATISIESGKDQYLMLITQDSVIESPNTHFAAARWQLPPALPQGPIPGSYLQVPPALPAPVVAPTLTFTGTPTSLVAGNSVALNWACTNGSTASASSTPSLTNWNGSKPLSGSQGITLSTSTVFTLTCTGSTGLTATKQVSVTVTPATAPPTVTLTANPTTIVVGQQTTLGLSTVNATSCNASNDRGLTTWSGSVAVNTSKLVAPTANTVFAVSCTGPGGTTQASIPVTVNPAPPTLTFTASPLSITSGQAVSGNWSTTNATSCSASNNAGLATWTGSKPVSGTTALYPTANVILTLSCLGPGGSVTKTVTITVTAPTPAPTVTFTANPGSIVLGQTASLGLSATNATSCSASNNAGLATWSGSVGTSVMRTVSPTADTVFSVTCIGAGGQTTKMATVLVTPVSTGGSIRLFWDPNSETDLAGYSLSWGRMSGMYTQSVALPKTAVSHEVTGLSDGTYYFAIRAFNSGGMYSGYSNEVEVVISTAGTTTTSNITGSNVVIFGDPMVMMEPELAPEGLNQIPEDEKIRETNEVEVVKEDQDQWVEDPETSGWQTSVGWIWKQYDPNDPMTVVQKNWVLSTNPSKTLPGDTVKPDEVFTARDGNHFWTSITYVPKDGSQLANINRPGEEGPIVASRLVWFYHIRIADGKAYYHPVALVAALEGNQGHVVYARDMEGVWRTYSINTNAKFDMVIPDLGGWIRIERIRY